MKFVKKCELLGFMTIMAKRKEDREEVIVVKDEVCGTSSFYHIDFNKITKTLILSRYIIM